MTSPFDDDGTLAANAASLPVIFFRGADEARYERECVLGEGGRGTRFIREEHTSAWRLREWIPDSHKRRTGPRTNRSPR